MDILIIVYITFRKFPNCGCNIKRPIKYIIPITTIERIIVCNFITLPKVILI